MLFAKTIRTFGVPFALLVASVLGGCDRKVNASDDVVKQEGRKICFVDVGGSYGKSGIRARQYVGHGPKFKVVQWKTLDFPDTILTDKPQIYYNRYPSIAVQVSWRASLINDNIESSFESMEVMPVNMKPDVIKRIRKWQISIVDNEKYEFRATIPDGKNNSELFSSEARGIVMPSQVGEAIGGVNGSYFRIAALDNNDKIIVEKNIAVSRGYDFKGRAREANEELANLVNNPATCQNVTG